jgi:hypothetical protein
MKHKNRLLLLVAFVFLAIPLALVLNAGAASTVLPNVNIWFGNNSINENGGWRIDDPSCVMHPEAAMLDECRRIMLSSYTDQTTCQTQICADGSAKTVGFCNAAGFSMVNQGTWQNICSDLAYSTQIACLAAPGNFSWTSAFCSDPQYTSETACTTNAGAWTAAVCSNPVYTSATTCTTAYASSGNSWFTGGCSNPSYTTASTCTTNTWDGTTCSNPVYTTQPTCSLATWTLPSGPCSNPVYTTAGTCTTGAARSNNTWDPTPYCTNPSYTDALSCTTVPSGRTWTPACTATWADGSSVTAGFYGTLALCSDPAYADVTSCTTNGGDWQQLWTGSYNGGCQRCHGYTSRGTNDVWDQGAEFPMNSHRNALRRVTPGVPLGGSDWTSSNSTIPNQTNLSTSTAITYIFPEVTGAAPYSTNLSSAEYIVGGWYKAVKRAQVLRVPVTGNEPVIMTDASCAECHATGYVGKGGVGVGRYGLSSGGNKWLYDGVQCAECHSSWPIYTSNSIMENPPIPGTQVCTNCHQQRVGGVAGTVQPAQLAVDSVTGEFVGFPIGNQFLNSPHGKFIGSAASQIGSPNAYNSSFRSGTTNAYCSDPNFSTLATCTAGSGSWAGTCSSPAYLVAGTCTTNGGSWTVAATVNVNAGCINCHDVHVGAVDPDAMDPNNTLNNIKNSGSCSNCHGTVFSGVISHPSGPNTPLDGNLSSVKGRDLACVTCHMGPDLNHLVRINTDAGYSTATPGNSFANTYDDNGYTPAVGLDIDLACGQCHGGSGAAKAGIQPMSKDELALAAVGMHDDSVINCLSCHNASSTPSINQGVDHHVGTCTDCHSASARHSGTPQYNLTDASCASCHAQSLAKMNYHVPGSSGIPGSCTTCHIEPGTQIDLDASCGACHGGSGDAQPGIPPFTVDQLVVKARDIHNIKPKATFSWTSDLTTSFMVNFIASGCPSGDTCTYDWDYGDGSAHGTGATPSHTYAGATAQMVTLIITDTTSSGVSDPYANTVLPVSRNVAPTAVRTINQSGWTVNVVDASTDDAALPAGAVFVDWGNGTNSNGNAGTTISKTYTVAGTYIIRHSVLDAGGLRAWSVNTSVSVPVKYTVSGKVTMLNGTTPILNASVRLKKGTSIVKMTTTNATGDYSLTDVLPDSYTVEAVKSGLTFSSTPAAVVTNANLTGINITATR